MFKQAKLGLILLLTALVSGCAGLGNMKEIAFEENVAPNTATINIVRRSVLMGDGVKAEIWDGDKFIGTLAAGKLLQYQAEPGHHNFMAYMQGHWGIASGEIKPNGTYYLKINLSGWGPINLGVAKPDDARIPVWKEMTTITLDVDKPKPVPEKYVKQARGILERIEAGDAIITPITEFHAY